MRRLRSLVVRTAAALILPAGAPAHADLDSASPGYRQRLQRNPPTVALRFSMPVTAFRNSIEVRSANGLLVSARARPARDPRTVIATLRDLASGAYTVRWHILSSGDGHVVSGVYTFGVRASAPEPTQAYGATGPSWAEKLTRWGCSSRSRS